jgi:hypothetical protein
LVTTGLSLVVSAAPAAAGERVLYAYATRLLALGLLVAG